MVYQSQIDDGFLSHVVICEVIEDTFIMNSGYREFSSVEVGVRAVGRARRVNNGMSSEAKEQEVQDTTFTIRDLGIIFLEYLACHLLMNHK